MIVSVVNFRQIGSSDPQRQPDASTDTSGSPVCNGSMAPMGATTEPELVTKAKSTPTPPDPPGAN
ncbi:hypothetical protein ZHAS_00010421 [Anopheles sinensis]|uniref:Uncharacterized protein n=1 Tax=Anopheles sinensis TaxID=74873 RepID=A0A084VXJ0_ANOSI|nr:hypothetical protein ZHAS_00010421 [Anopheles sinensis]